MQSTLSLLSLRNILLIVWAATAVGLKNVFPAYFWVTVLSLPALSLLMQEMEFLKSPVGKRLSFICFCLFIFHALWAWIRAEGYSAASPGTYWRDDHNYFIEAAAIADSWSQGFFPEIWKKGSPPYLGTIHVGYHRPLAAIFLVTGPSTVAGLLLNAACASLLPMLVAFTSCFLWGDRKSAYAAGAVSMRNPIYASAILTALHPNQFYWASYMMKDMYTSFVFLALLTLILGTLRNRSLSYGIAALLLAPYLFSIRIYAAVSLLVGAMLFPALRFKKSAIVQVAFVSLLVLVLVTAYTLPGYRLFQQMMSSLIALSPAAVDGPLALLLRMGAGIPALFLAPYAWLRFDVPTPMYGMYPGMWYLYLIGYPLGFAGLYAALRQNVNLAIIPIAALGFGALLFLTSAYGGNAARQRFYMEYVMLIFAGYGFSNPSKRWFFCIYAAELAFAVGQVMSLR